LHHVGDGHLSRPEGPASPSAAENRYSMDEIDNLLTRSAPNFRTQRELLTNMPPKSQERSLQIYFW